jgi:GTPase
VAIPSFVDRVTLHVHGGKGGHGCASVHREKFKPLGGPDGGNGGDGGSVILRVEAGLTTLVDYYRESHRRATNGQPGKGSHANGGNGETVVLPVPNGTVVTDADTGEQLADLTGTGAEVVVARGGRGGLGNAALASSKRKAPGFALLGEPGDELEIVLELKVVADIGLVGFPSAGKSSLIAALSRARPKIADYPFTTLSPNLGVVSLSGDRTLVVADVPGLIEGAHEGHGLGHRFLSHLERTKVLVQLVDVSSASGRDTVEDFDVITRELALFPGRDESGERLADKPVIVAATKIDALDDPDRLRRLEQHLQSLGIPLYPVSAATGEGLDRLLEAIWSTVAAREPHPGADAPDDARAT